ncbi:chymotrypsin-C-like [Anopheles ziemanni]|uniref:chymotrypsin-C-like n=1 Tax=Anopheles coustani TaxID=139045 RepID=UPI002658421C|nr:chymotrypsin-C-like [Anopheles coustani]XP_058168786.1 chymotrypsin-C-like [Anopheles ziemanni]
MAKFCALTFLLVCVAGSLAQVPDTVRDAFPGEFPSVVVVKTPEEERFCLGEVIDATHILTSAFCVLNAERTRVFPARLVRVFGGDISTREIALTRQTRVAQHIFVHENYRSHAFENNLAVIRLAEPFHLPSNAIEPAVIRMRIVPDNHACYALNWVRPEIGVTVTFTPRLQAVPVTIRNRDLCNTDRLIEPNVREDNLCMQQSNTFITLQGDPLFCDGQLTAIHSWRWDLTQQTPIVSNLVSTQVRFHMHWIHQQLNRTQPMPPGWNPVEF